MTVAGWDQSAQAWLDEQGDHGDWSRRFILDRVMLDRVRAAAPKTALDVGCGEGRFCRILAAEGIAARGIEPTRRLREEAVRRDPKGTYLDAMAEDLPFPDASFDMVIAYLTLIDIDGYREAIAEMARVLTPGGHLLIANLNSFNTANAHHTWIETDKGRLYPIDHYLEARKEDVAWRDMAIQNWHRPLCDYMQALLQTGLILTFFDEPAPQGYPETDEPRADRNRRVPYFVVMEWQKPSGPQHDAV